MLITDLPSNAKNVSCGFPNGVFNLFITQNCAHSHIAQNQI